MRRTGPGQVWVKIGRLVLQVETPTPLQDWVDFMDNDKLTTLYTQQELKDWESFKSFPAMQRSRHQKILNALCIGEQCSYRLNSLFQKIYDLEKLSLEAKEAGEALLDKINPFGFFNRQWNLFNPIKAGGSESMYSLRKRP